MMAPSLTASRIRSTRCRISLKCITSTARQLPSGGVAEWSKALVLKTSEVNASQGSNPCPSARYKFNVMFLLPFII